MLKKLAAFSPSTYIIAFAVAATYTAIVGGFAYHRGALSNAKEIGELTVKLTAEQDSNKACIDIGKKQTDSFKQMQADAERRAEEARKIAEQSRLLADAYRKKATLIARMKPSTSCGEAAGRLRDQLRIERGMS